MAMRAPVPGAFTVVAAGAPACAAGEVPSALSLIHIFRAALQQQLWQIAAEARRQADQPLGMLPEQIVVDARLVVKALRKPSADELDKVVIAGLVFAQQNHVAVFTRLSLIHI